MEALLNGLIVMKKISLAVPPQDFRRAGGDTEKALYRKHFSAIYLVGDRDRQDSAGRIQRQPADGGGDRGRVDTERKSGMRRGGAAVGKSVYAGYALSDLRSGSLQANGNTGPGSRIEGLP